MFDGQRSFDSKQHLLQLPSIVIFNHSHQESKTNRNKVRYWEWLVHYSIVVWSWYLHVSGLAKKVIFWLWKWDKEKGDMLFFLK